MIAVSFMAPTFIALPLSLFQPSGHRGAMGAVRKPAAIARRRRDKAQPAHIAKNLIPGPFVLTVRWIDIRRKSMRMPNKALLGNSRGGCIL
ncbi:MAG: hypothetical protein EBV03_08780 [Proteobacteria bacterium]|nr:hypothetical protein [Pseudomonadota bacterium]